MTEPSTGDTTGHVHHTIDYVEINVTDLDGTKAFYAAAFGWAFNDYGPEHSGIRWVEGDGEVGGLNATRTPVRGGPLVLLWSADLDTSLAAVVSAGGAVVEGPYDFPGGRRFHFTDPSGNELGVWGA